MVTSYVLDPTVNERRKLLCSVMHKEGFANYPGEWWHFSYGDQLWAAYSYKRYAIYGSLNKICTSCKQVQKVQTIEMQRANAIGKRLKICYDKVFNIIHCSRRFFSETSGVLLPF